jgi:hypothetical protein
MHKIIIIFVVSLILVGSVTIYRMNSGYRFIFYGSEGRQRIKVYINNDRNKLVIISFPSQVIIQSKAIAANSIKRLNGLTDVFVDETISPGRVMFKINENEIDIKSQELLINNKKYGWTGQINL